MSREAPKQVKSTETIASVMQRYGGVFSIDLASGFAHMKFQEDGEMYITWLNEDGYVEEDGHEVPFKDIERVANFMKEMKALRLSDYKNEV